MNLFVFMGRLTKEPDVRYTNDSKCIAKFTLAVDRRFQKDTTDFFDCTAFGKTAEFIEKHVTKGTKVVITGTVQNNNWTNKEGKKVYGTAFIVDNIEFADSRKKEEKKEEPKEEPAETGWMNIPENESPEELPFI